MAAGRCNIAASGLRIKSEQHGVVKIGGTHAADSYKDITINPVDVAKSIIIMQWEGSYADTPSYSAAFFKSDVNNVVSIRNHQYGYATVHWQVLELEGFKSIQYFNYYWEWAGDSSPNYNEITIPINTVNPKKTLLFYSYTLGREYSQDHFGFTAYVAAPGDKVSLYRWHGDMLVNVHCFVLELE